MQSVTVRSHIGSDGLLNLQIPVELKDVDVEVVVVVQQINGHLVTDTEALGWPPGFFEETYGSFKDEPLERPPQGDFEIREELR
jgi:hypothetical protein